MDNSASFIGDMIHPRHFSRIVRLCLHVGVEPVFIASGKPWMNGKIEMPIFITIEVAFNML
ncbi:MAG TPA: hypothetical protein VFC84_13060 [Desulfosporosinus sp.]|nr:hypothetical protein [Desulfosporosinus sp.]